ncbi:MAG: pyruvate:ferredoxin (flavodoxin) oxidoreductase [Myxococcales bacterium]|nr:pyruvate:ferredoxin (flavodoxin) oxidoreductase [Myxococcales bacterium]MDH3485194.1 pyruvate:ferredoxin (flavodoxin) oxidoreductase [Myxococcales bacterium]
MSITRVMTVDGNEAVAMVAHRTNEVIAIYPITPSSAMGELSDEWSAHGQCNIWGALPKVVEMQSEGGAAGAVHGSLQAGALTTTFTASQGLLLFIPNMYKIAGELNAFCMHVAARSIASHALSIFCDHSDVMACRQTGFALLASGSVQEAHDFAAIGQASTLQTRVPFLHFFDGFRTSHEVAKIESVDDDDLRWLIGDEGVEHHRSRGLTPDHPHLRGTAQNPDVFFQAREAGNPFYLACPEIVQAQMDRFAERAGRHYRLFDYVGAPDAERVVILMGSGAQTAEEMVQWLTAHGEKVGVLKVRLYRPFSVSAFAEALPPSVRRLAVLDRTKEPGSIGEPLYLDVVAALRELRDAGNSPLEVDPLVMGGRYGLSSKEFTPAMVKAVFDELCAERPRNHFTVGIVDDVTHTSLSVDSELDIEPDDVVRAVFFGLGSDGTVGANKNAIKIIGEQTQLHAQGYFVYDSKKSGAMTISHLRFGPRPIHSAYLVRKASFVACHQFAFLGRYDVLDYAGHGAVFLLNAPYPPDEVWDALPREVQQTILEKELRLYAIDAYKLADELGLGRRINTLMQTCFFAISGVLPRDEAIAQIKKAIEKTYGAKGHAVVARNFEAVDRALDNLHQVRPPTKITTGRERPPIVPAEAPDFVKQVTALMLAGKGDLLPVSAFPVDGTWPVGTSKWEKRNIAQQIPVWDSDLCIQCNKCAMVCPHAAIRAKVFDPVRLEDAPPTYKAVAYRGAEFTGSHYTIQVAPEDCTGCLLCAAVCPAKDKSNPRHKAIDMAPSRPLVETERENYAFFLDLPEADRTQVKLDIKGSQFFEPLFEYSGACSGCGETPYIKLLTQLFGDRALIANATGCSSIYGGNLPTTPYTTNGDGRGPAWSNSLFEDNAEFGLGFRLALDRHVDRARRLVITLASNIGEGLVDELLQDRVSGEAEIQAQRQRVDELRLRLAKVQTKEARELEQAADYLVKKSIWLVGGDGWAYDIGFGGLDHVLAMDHDVNMLVLDTEVYSNTGGQQSKATPIGAAAKFAVAGKEISKKDLGLEAMSYGHAYVARVAFGAKDNQTVHAFVEADSFRGPSLIIAYSPCIAHGYDLSRGLEQQKLAVKSGMWPLYRFDPRRVQRGEPPFQLDSGAPKGSVKDYMRNEARFRMVEKIDPKRSKHLQRMAQEDALRRYWVYRKLAGATPPAPEPPTSTTPPPPMKEEGR